jgi:hypothetical protein
MVLATVARASGVFAALSFEKTRQTLVLERVSGS